MIKNMEEISMLYDFYGDLLTERQNTVLQYYYGDDYTLAEIAEKAGISRQAVHDTVHKAEKALKTYESALGLVARYRHNRHQIKKADEELKSVIDGTDDESLKGRLGSVVDIINGLE